MCFVDHVEKLKAHGGVIKDDSNALTCFCETFEEILREGSRSKFTLGLRTVVCGFLFVNNMKTRSRAYQVNTFAV